MRQFIVEADFVSSGLRCVVIFGSLGHRCGYVGVPEGHFMFGKKYSDKFLDFEDVKGDEVGKRGIIPIVCALDEHPVLVSPDIYFNVHGSLTYSGPGNGKDKAGNTVGYPVESELWWFGFDCAHYDDGVDIQQAFKYGLVRAQDITDNYAAYTGLDGIVRSQEYVEHECRSLAEQIAAATIRKAGKV